MINLLTMLIQRTLPMVFDESMSMVELLAAVVAKVNEMVTAQNAYFSVDLVTNVTNILRGWQTDGTLGDIISDALQTQIDTVAGDLDTAEASVADILASLAAPSSFDTALDGRVTALEGGSTQVDNLGVVNVKDYGATGNGSTDDIASFLAAIAALPASGGLLYIPAGNYLLSAPLAVSSKDLTIMGAGEAMTKLFFSGSDGIVYATTNAFTDSIIIRDLAVVALTDNIYKGISISFPSNTGSPWKNASVENVVVTGATSVVEYNENSNHSQQTNGWEDGLYINNAAASHILNSMFRVGVNIAGNARDGIHILGTTTDILIQGCKFYGMDVAIRKTGSSEGAVIDHCALINVGRGIVFNEGVTVQNGVYVLITNCHINYYNAGIYILYQPQVTISNCLMYMAGSVTGGADILLNACPRSIIHHNTLIVKGGSAYSDGVIVTNTAGVSIFGNIIQERATGIWLTSSATDIRLALNDVHGASYDILDQSTSGTTDIQETTKAFSQLVSLGAGATEVNIGIPAGFFGSKPTAASLASASGTQHINGWYDYDASTPTNAHFFIQRNDETAIGAETIRFSCIASGR